MALIACIVICRVNLGKSHENTANLDEGNKLGIVVHLEVIVSLATTMVTRILSSRFEVFP